MLQMILTVVWIMIGSFVFHELGHVVYYYIVYQKVLPIYFDARKASIIVGTPADYVGVSDVHYFAGSFAGVLAGLVPIHTFIIIYPGQSLIYAVVLLGYIATCYTDIKIMKRITQKWVSNYGSESRSA